MVMRKLILLCVTAGAVALVAGSVARAAGTNTVSYVSSGGADSPHTCTNPTTDACATFQYALTQTVNHGEIDCANTGNYGSTFTIGQSVTIDCAGGVGSTFGDISINGSGIVVRLRNLSINNNGNGFDGINVVNLTALYVEHCVIGNDNSGPGSPYFGIQFQPSAGTAYLYITDSVISNNGSSAAGTSSGIYIEPASNVTAMVTIDRSEISGNYSGIIADGRSGGIINGTLRDSVVSGNTVYGIGVISSGSNVWWLLDQTKVSANANGLAAIGSGARMAARNTSVFNNTTGLTTRTSGAIYSYGTNSLIGNGTNGAFTGTLAMQ